MEEQEWGLAPVLKGPGGVSLSSAEWGWGLNPLPQNFGIGTTLTVSNKEWWIWPVTPPSKRRGLGEAFRAGELCFSASLLSSLRVL